MRRRALGVLMFSFAATVALLPDPTTPTPPGMIRVHTTQGMPPPFSQPDWDLLVHPKHTDAGVSASIHKHGGCCRGTSHFLRESVHALQKNASRHLVALDIGANIGYHTVELGKLGCRVVAWELLPLNFRVLAANFKMHGLGDSVALVPRGASDQARSVTVRSFVNSPGMTTLGDGGLPWKMEELNGTPLRVAPAAEELARLGVTRVDIVKIDVEGHEIEALRGLGPSLRRLGVQQHGQSAPLGSAPARLLCLPRACLAALGSSALSGSGRPTGRPAAASGAQASHLQTRRCHRL